MGSGVRVRGWVTVRGGVRVRLLVRVRVRLGLAKLNPNPEPNADANLGPPLRSVQVQATTIIRSGTPSATRRALGLGLGL